MAGPSKRVDADDRSLRIAACRGTRRLALTAEGEVFAARLETILDQVRELDMAAHVGTPPDSSLRTHRLA
ncbi:hypothetical protein ACQEVB_30365 [Pseudonocardia sp. CA-107938]|uniref:hypothetical protein n=1 Tax=Pseudonocardia sp. CA-107938 TaxID=3240021 RepID=UPI003D89D30D